MKKTAKKSAKKPTKLGRVTLAEVNAWAAGGPRRPAKTRGGSHALE